MRRDRFAAVAARATAIILLAVVGLSLAAENAAGSVYVLKRKCWQGNPAQDRSLPPSIAIFLPTADSENGWYAGYAVLPGWADTRSKAYPSQAEIVVGRFVPGVYVDADGSASPDGYGFSDGGSGDAPGVHWNRVKASGDAGSWMAVNVPEGTLRAYCDGFPAGGADSAVAVTLWDTGTGTAAENQGPLVHAVVDCSVETDGTFGDQPPAYRDHIRGINDPACVLMAQWPTGAPADLQIRWTGSGSSAGRVRGWTFITGAGASNPGDGVLDPASVIDIIGGGYGATSDLTVADGSGHDASFHAAHDVSGANFSHTNETWAIVDGQGNEFDADGDGTWGGGGEVRAVVDSVRITYTADVVWDAGGGSTVARHTETQVYDSGGCLISDDWLMTTGAAAEGLRLPAHFGGGEIQMHLNEDLATHYRFAPDGSWTAIVDDPGQRLAMKDSSEVRVRMGRTQVVRRAWSTFSLAAYYNGRTCSPVVNSQVICKGDPTQAIYLGADLANLLTARALAGGDWFTMSQLREVELRGDGLAWGDNQYGQAGDGTQVGRDVPVVTVNSSDVVAVAGGDGFSLSVREDGTVWACGRNNAGQLGDGTASDRNVLVRVAGLAEVVSAAAGAGHAVALRSDGTVWAWGRNGAGQLGDGTTTNRHAPVQVVGPGDSGFLTEVIAVAAGGEHSLAIRSDGSIWAWGRNDSGQLGDGTAADRSAPVPVTGLPTVVAIAGGQGHSLALSADGTVYAWGGNSSGQLGDGTAADRYTPVQVVGPLGGGALSGVAALAAGASHSVALRDNGTVWCWGDNICGQLGDDQACGLVSRTPVQAAALTDAVAVACGRRHSLALGADGAARAWGENAHGQLGIGPAGDRWAPTQLTAAGTLASIAAGGDHSLGLSGPLETYTLAASTNAPALGSVGPAAPVTGCAYGEPIPLVATAEPGCHFVEWSGDLGSVVDSASPETIWFATANHAVTAVFSDAQVGVRASVAPGRQRCYENTPVATSTVDPAGNHHTTVTLTLAWEANPGDTYTVSIDDGDCNASEDQFRPGDVAQQGGRIEVRLYGGWAASSTPGTYPVTLTVEDESGNTASATVDLQLLRLGDIDGDGSVGGTDKQALNNCLNGFVPPGLSHRELDIDGDGSVGGSDKSILNGLLYGLMPN